MKTYKEKYGHLDINKKEDWGLDCTDITEVKSIQLCHANETLNSAATPDGQLLLKSKSMHVTENGMHQLDGFGTKCKPFGEQKETLLSQPTACSRKSKGKYKSSFEKIEERKSFYNKHGHISVSEKEDRRLAVFCRNVRYAHKNSGISSGKLGKERIASLDALGFNWRLNSTPRKSFEERIKDLRSYKDEHGHLNVEQSQDKSLAQFCIEVRYTRTNPGKGGRIKLNEEGIASLDALGLSSRNI